MIIFINHFDTYILFYLLIAISALSWYLVSGSLSKFSYSFNPNCFLVFKNLLIVLASSEPSDITFLLSATEIVED